MTNTLFPTSRKTRSVLLNTPKLPLLITTVFSLILATAPATLLYAGEEKHLNRTEGTASKSKTIPHAKHRSMMSKKYGYKRSMVRYQLPDVEIQNMDGDSTQLLAVLNQDSPVILNFIFTTCTTVCPVLTATFAQAQKGLMTAKTKPRMISISIDPEYDTPERLRKYAKKFKAGPQWQFFTGESKIINNILQAFRAYRGSKLNHEPVTFLRISSNDPWVRLDGFTSAGELVKEYQSLLAK